MGLLFILVTMFERVGLSTCGYNLTKSYQILSIILFVFETLNLEF